GHELLTHPRRETRVKYRAAYADVSPDQEAVYRRPRMKRSRSIRPIRGVWRSAGKTAQAAGHEDSGDGHRKDRRGACGWPPAIPCGAADRRDCDVVRRAVDAIRTWTAGAASARDPYAPRSFRGVLYNLFVAKPPMIADVTWTGGQRFEAISNTLSMVIDGDSQAGPSPVQ